MHTGGHATRSTAIRRWLLAAALIAGLVGMHHLMAHPEHPTHGSEMSAGMGAGTASVAAHAAAMAPSASVAADAAGAMGMVMHMCLAILVGLILLGLSAVLVGLLRRDQRGAAPPRTAVVSWVRPPPRTAVRLARLCVLRN